LRSSLRGWTDLKVPHLAATLVQKQRINGAGKATGWALAITGRAHCGGVPEKLNEVAPGTFLS
jgi:hypothetical protein